MDLNSFLYSASSYHAIARPVTIAMVLAALASVYINDADTLASGAQQLSEAYTVFKLSNDNTGAAFSNLVKSIGNTLVICVTIAIMTFLIVILYKYKCMKVLTGYMIFSSASLLGFLGGSIVQVGAYIYNIPIDTLSFLIILYNFAAVGILAIFFPHGIPQYITQGYLVATAVILAWNLAHFDDWTAWTLLVMLAIYDLWAVLSPYGPLKALVQLMQQKDSPDMPGLLYEAKLENHHTSAASTTIPRAALAVTTTKTHHTQTNKSIDATTATRIDDTTNRTTYTTSTTTSEHTTPPFESTTTHIHPSYTSIQHTTTAATCTGDILSTSVIQLPLAIARIYQLTPCAQSYHRYPQRTGNDGNPTSYNSGGSSSSSSSSSTTTTLDYWDSSHADEPLLRHVHHTSNSPPISPTMMTCTTMTTPRINNTTTTIHNNPSTMEASFLHPSTFYKQKFTKQELISDITVLLPRNKGRIEQTWNKHHTQAKYWIYNADGMLKRILMVNRRNGQVYQIHHDKDNQNGDEEDDYYDDDDDNDESISSSIRLGLVCTFTYLSFIFFTLAYNKVVVTSVLFSWLLYTYIEGRFYLLFSVGCQSSHV